MAEPDALFRLIAEREEFRERIADLDARIATYPRADYLRDRTAYREARAMERAWAGHEVTPRWLADADRCMHDAAAKTLRRLATSGVLVRVRRGVYASPEREVQS